MPVPVGPTPFVSTPYPIATVPQTNVYVPTYGQTSVINSPYVPGVVQPITGSIVAPVQPYGPTSIIR